MKAQTTRPKPITLEQFNKLSFIDKIVRCQEEANYGLTIKTNTYDNAMHLLAVTIMCRFMDRAIDKEQASFFKSIAN